MENEEKCKYLSTRSISIDDFCAPNLCSYYKLGKVGPIMTLAQSICVRFQILRTSLFIFFGFWNQILPSQSSMWLLIIPRNYRYWIIKASDLFIQMCRLKNLHFHIQIKSMASHSLKSCVLFPIPFFNAHPPISLRRKIAQGSLEKYYIPLSDFSMLSYLDQSLAFT